MKCCYRLTVHIALYRPTDLSLSKEREVVGTIISLAFIYTVKDLLVDSHTAWSSTSFKVKESAQTGFPRLSSLASLKVRKRLVKQFFKFYKLDMILSLVYICNFAFPWDLRAGKTMRRQNKTKSLWSLKIRFQSKKPISLVKVVFVTFCNAVKPDFYFPSLYFRNLQIKLAMLF